MASMIERTCKNRQCGAKFMARTADVARGWGLFCSKSCKARGSKLGQGHRDYLRLAPPAPRPGRMGRDRIAQQECMYELGLRVEQSGWDDSAWQMSG